MKKHYYIYAILAFALVIALPAVTRADQDGSSGDSDASVNAGVNIGSPVPPPPAPANASASIRDRIRADYQARLENMKNNQDSRNVMLEARMASSTMRPPMRGDNDAGDEATDSIRFRDNMPHAPRSLASSTFMGSTTMRERFNVQYEDNGRAMRLGMFEIRKAVVTKELDVAVSNLDNISSRLSSRIQKEEAAGHDMSAGTSALATANLKITTASDAVSALEAYLPNATSTVTASTTVNLDTARSMVSTAKDAIKAAQDSLNDVVTAIAHALGIQLNASASSTVSQ